MIKVGMTTKDLLNAKGGSNSLQAIKEQVIKVTGIATDLTTNEDGKEVQVAYFATQDGDIFGSISATVISSAEFIIDAITDNELTFPIDIRVNGRTSKGGREFLTLTVM